MINIIILTADSHHPTDIVDLRLHKTMGKLPDTNPSTSLNQASNDLIELRAVYCASVAPISNRYTLMSGRDRPWRIPTHTPIWRRFS
jgi:hypothetical protein